VGIVLGLAFLGLAVLPVMIARYSSGTCPECRNPIRKEDPIVEIEPGRRVHEECVPLEVEENWDWPDRGEVA
jgi:hypothetical protein